MKFSVVPDSSERLTGMIRVSGSSTPGFSLAIAGSFQFSISWLKIFARVSGVELQFFDAREVVDDRDRRDVGRDLDQFAGSAALDRFAELAFLFGERRVGAGEGDAAGDELFATAAGADRVVGDRRAAVGVLEFGDPGFLRRLLRAGAGAGDFAGDFGRSDFAATGFAAFAAAAARAVVAAPAGGHAEREHAADANTASHLELDISLLFVLLDEIPDHGQRRSWREPVSGRPSSLLPACSGDVKKM